MIILSAKPVVEKSGGKLVERNVPVKCQIQRSYPPANITWQMQPFCLERIAKCSPNDSLWRNVAKDNFKIVSSTSYSELFVQPQDKGNYFFRCVAQNILGVDDSNFVKSLYFREGRWNQVRLLLKHVSGEECHCSWAATICSKNAPKNHNRTGLESLD